MCLLLSFSQSKSDAGLPMSMMLQPLMSIVWSFGIIFAICEFGERLTMQFIAFDNTIWQSNWYAMPTKLQRMLLVLIANAQQNNFLKSYGSIECTRDSFKMVWKIALLLQTIYSEFKVDLFWLHQTIHKGYSYFMLLRQMYD